MKRRDAIFDPVCSPALNPFDLGPNRCADFESLIKRVEWLSTLHFCCEILDSALKSAKISYRKMERAGLGVTQVYDRSKSPRKRID